MAVGKSSRALAAATSPPSRPRPMGIATPRQGSEPSPTSATIVLPGTGTPGAM